jgi:undecaprenyl-diphosphatase
VIHLWNGKHRRVAAVLALAPLVASAVILIGKAIFQRPRPLGALRVGDLSFAFPSGHATTSTAVYVTLAWILVSEHQVDRRIAITLAVLLPLVVGISRLYLDVHWATDVIGGWSIGLFIATASIALYEHVRDVPLPILHPQAASFSKTQPGTR